MKNDKISNDEIRLIATVAFDEVIDLLNQTIEDAHMRKAEIQRLVDRYLEMNPEILGGIESDENEEE